MSLCSRCSYFPVLCCCGCRNSIFFHDAKIRIFSESAKTKSYTGGRKSVSVGEYAMVHTRNRGRLTTENSRQLLTRQLNPVARLKSDNLNQQTTLLVCWC